MSAERGEKLELVRSSIKSYPDFPKRGILFHSLEHPNSTVSPRSLIQLSEADSLVNGLAIKCKRDINPLLKDPKAFSAVIDLFEDHLRKKFAQVELIVGLDARGFLFGPALAQRLGIGFVPIRKKGKLPGEIISMCYQLEYGEDQIEVQADQVQPQQKVVIIDDVLATGGTMAAAYNLMKKLGADVLECSVVIEIKELKGIEKLDHVPFYSLVQF